MTAWMFVLVAAASAQDFWPGFYGRYAVTGRICESTLNDSGCAPAAHLVVENIRGISTLSVYDNSGTRLRSNDLVEKTGGGLTYSLSGDAESAVFTAEGVDSRGRRYFYNRFEIRRGDTVVFTQTQESDHGGFKNALKRVYQLRPE